MPHFAWCFAANGGNNRQNGIVPSAKVDKFSSAQPLARVDYLQPSGRLVIYKPLTMLKNKLNVLHFFVACGCTSCVFHDDMKNAVGSFGGHGAL